MLSSADIEWDLFLRRQSSFYSLWNESSTIHEYFGLGNCKSAQNICATVSSQVLSLPNPQVPSWFSLLFLSVVELLCPPKETGQSFDYNDFSFFIFSFISPFILTLPFHCPLLCIYAVCVRSLFLATHGSSRRESPLNLGQGLGLFSFLCS